MDLTASLIAFKKAHARLKGEAHASCRSARQASAHPVSSETTGMDDQQACRATPSAFLPELLLWKTRTAALRVVSRRRREGTSCGRRSRPALGSSGSIGAMSCAPAGREGTPGAVVPGDAEHSRGAAAGGRATRLQERQQKSCDTRAPARVTGAFTLSSDMGFGQHRLGLRPLRAVGCGNSAWAAVNRSLAAVNADLRPFECRFSGPRCRNHGSRGRLGPTAIPYQGWDSGV
jgi:hypothetical protein